MSPPFIRTIILAPFLVFIGCLGLLFASILAHADDPPPVILFSNTSTQTSDGTLVYFTIRLENATRFVHDEASDTFEPHVSSGHHVRSFLSAGNLYFLSANAYHEPGVPAFASDFCSASPTSIDCEVPPILGRHLNHTDTEFVNGYAEIVLYTYRTECGPVSNLALLLPFRTATATAPGIPCPTPIPTQPPPTSTPPPSTPTATQPPPAPSPTSTPPSVAPLPPNTGNSPPTENSPDRTSVLAGTFMLVFFGTILTVGLYRMTRRK